MKLLRNSRNEKGASTVSYAVLATSIAVLCISAITLYGQKAADRACDNALHLDKAGKISAYQHNSIAGYYDNSQKKCCTPAGFGPPDCIS